MVGLFWLFDKLSILPRFLKKKLYHLTLGCWCESCDRLFYCPASQHQCSVVCQKNKQPSREEEFERREVVNSSNLPNIEISEEVVEVDQSFQKPQKIPGIEPEIWEEIDEEDAVREVIEVRSKEYKDELTTSFNHTSIVVSSENVYVVVDTCVLLSNLSFFHEMKGTGFIGDIYCTFNYLLKLKLISLFRYWKSPHVPAIRRAL
jgi:hypothetical protein